MKKVHRSERRLVYSGGGGGVGGGVGGDGGESYGLT